MDGARTAVTGPIRVTLCGRPNGPEVLDPGRENLQEGRRVYLVYNPCRRHSMLHVIEAIERRLSHVNVFLITLGVSFLVMGMLLNTVNIAGRYLFRAPIRSTYELTGLFMVLMICLGWPRTTEVKGHVSVDILTSRLPQSIRRGLELVTLLLGLFSFILMMWSSILTGLQFGRMDSCTDLLRIPYAPVSLLMALGAFLVSVILLFQFVHGVAEFSKRGNH
jgi:TRAP-type C4-dicarboxylate transport system permease small subunit